MIKRSPSLTDQVKAYIKQQILNNEYEDDRIPSETDLADALGVSRTTVRDALSRLENEGVIFRKQGAGTFVNRPGLQVRSRLDEIWSYEAALQAHGYQPSVKVLDVYRESVDSEAATVFGLTVDEKILIVKKLFLEDEQPVIFTCNYIPDKIIGRPFETSDLKVPVFDFLAEFGNQHLSYYLSEIVPLTAINEMATHLRIPVGTALISLEEIGYNEENEPILKALSYFRDDLLRLRLIRRKV